MKELILENPRKKSRKRRAHARRVTKRNPGDYVEGDSYFKATRTPAQKAATKKLVALSKKRKAKKSRKARKSTKSSKPKSTMARKSRKSRKCRKHIKHRRRLYALKGSLTRIKLNPFTGSVFNKENLTIASGAVVGSVATNYALGMIGDRMGAQSPYGRAAYQVALPVVAAMLVKRFSPNMAKGLVIGGLAAGIGQLVTASGLAPAGVTAPIQTATLPASSGGVREYLGEYVGGSSEMSSPDAFTNAW
jgi:hypothetical protein